VIPSLLGTLPPKSKPAPVARKGRDGTSGRDSDWNSNTKLTAEQVAAAAKLSKKKNVVASSKAK
jgi:hypothetical protein